MNLKYIIIILLLFSFSCQKKAFMCGLADNKQVDIDSEVLEFNRLGIADTTMASLSGYVFDKSYFKKIDSLEATLEYSNVWVKDVNSDSIYGIVTDQNGFFKLTFPSSTYDIEFQFVGYNNLKIENQKIGTGELLNCSVLMGSGSGKSRYKLDDLLRPIKINNVE